MKKNNNICPHCGLDTTNRIKNYSRNILAILNSFDDITVSALKRVHEHICSNQKEFKYKSDTYYKFLCRIRKIPEDIILDSISMFIDKGLHTTKEYSYLYAIIKNNQMIRERKIDEEILKNGRPPELQIL